MRANKDKIKLTMARRCMSTAELTEVAQMPRATVIKVTSGREVKPATIGRIAQALGVDVTEIMED